MDTDRTSHSVPSSLGLLCLQVVANYYTEWIIRLLLFMINRPIMRKKKKKKKNVFIKHTFWCVKETSPLRHFLYTSKRECVFTECEVLV